MSHFATPANAPQNRPARASNPFWLWGAVLVVAVAGGAATLYTQLLRETNPSLATIEPAHVNPHTDMPVLDEVPVVDIPLRERVPDTQGSLPALDESDDELAGWLGELFGRGAAELLVPERIVRNIVVTIDNLPRAAVQPDQRPVRPARGEIVTEGTEEEPVLSPANYARYEPFMALVRATDPAVPVALYRRFRPLFQEAYEDLGFPSRSFDDRLVEVIDHLLGTPELAEPVRLVRPRVMYQYADGDLEAQSAGRKWLMRMGPENVATVKERLRGVRAELRRY